MTQLIYIYKSGICLEPVNTTTKREGPREKRTSFCMHKEMWEGKIYHKGSGDYIGLRGEEQLAEMNVVLLVRQQAHANS